MLHILLLILKIIGMLLAVLLGTVLFVLLCILLVPIRYRVEAEGKLGKENPVRVGIKVSWLLHLIDVAVAYPGAAFLKVRVLCFTVFDSSRKKERKGRGKTRKKDAAESGADQAAESGRTEKAPQTGSKQPGEDMPEGTEGDTSGKDGTGEEESPGRVSVKAEGKSKDASMETEAGEDSGVSAKEEDAGEECSVSVKRKDVGEEDADIKSGHTDKEGSPDEKAGSDPKESGGDETSGEKEVLDGEDADIAEEKKGLWGKIKAFFLILKQIFEKIAGALKNIEYTIRQICDKIKKILRNIQYYTEVLKSETFRRVWGVSKKQLLRIFRMLRPQVCRINLLAGTGDPAGAGQILAIYGILYPLIGNNVVIEADFDNKVIEGDLFIKGRVRMLVFFIAAARLLVDKNIWRLLKMLKNPGV